MNGCYRSPFEAYPFLSDPSEDLRCDFEILTDRLSSGLGLLRALCKEEDIRADLLKLDELVYHMNASLRTRLTVTEEELRWVRERSDRLSEETAGRCARFVIPQGSERACRAHVLRTDCKALVRLLYRWHHAGNRVEDRLIDLANLLSGYCFYLALRLNDLDGVAEISFESRNY